MKDNQKTTHSYTRMINGITYSVNIHFKQNARESLLDKCVRLVKEDVKKC